jgi:ABC-type thiamine transport system ATPase subunit
LTGTGGVADESEYLMQKFGKRTSTARVFTSEDPVKLLDDCMSALKSR